MSKSQLELLIRNLVEIHNSLVLEPDNVRTNTKRLVEVIDTLDNYYSRIEPY